MAAGQVQGKGEPAIAGLKSCATYVVLRHIEPLHAPSAQFFSGFEEVAFWLSNVFQAALTACWHTAPPAVSALYGVVFGYGLATLLLLPWVRFFCARWLSDRRPAASVP